MKITLVNVQEPKELFQVLNACAGPVSCQGVDLRNNRELEKLICGLAGPGEGIPRLELTVSAADDCYQLLRYMREGGRAA